MTNLLPTISTVSEPLSYDRSEWSKGYLSQPNEYDYWIDDIEGEIPPDLEGTFYRNGPGLLDINGQVLRHPFDGDGMISAIRFANGRAHYRNRFVRTQGYVEEQKAGKILYRGVFGTQKPGGWLANFLDLRIKNIANTQVIYWADRLLALWEAAEPYRLDPIGQPTGPVLRWFSAASWRRWSAPDAAAKGSGPCRAGPASSTASCKATPSRHG